MLSAEFHYTEEFIDEYMDMPKYLAHLRYRNDNPPVGGLLKAIVDSFSTGEGGKGDKTHYRSTEVQLAEGEASYTDEGDGSMSDFMQAFAGFGGSVVSKKIEGGGENG